MKSSQGTPQAQTESGILIKTESFDDLISSSNCSIPTPTSMLNSSSTVVNSSNSAIVKSEFATSNEAAMTGNQIKSEPNHGVKVKMEVDDDSSNNMDEKSMDDFSKSEFICSSQNGPSLSKLGANSNNNSGSVCNSKGGGKMEINTTVKQELSADSKSSPVSTVVSSSSSVVATTAATTTSTSNATITTTSNNTTTVATRTPNSRCNRTKKVFNPGELRQALMPTLEKLYRQDPESLPFRQPVDPQALNIPDYFDIIRRPMDLSTIKTKLDTCQYQDPWQYVDDVWLMFENAWTYNRKTSKVYRHCTKLKEVFEHEIDPAMQTLGYCCGRKFVFQPQVLCCYGKQLCTSPRDVKYMSYQNRITYCMKCFQDIAGETVTIGDAYGLDTPGVAPQIIPKNQFVECKNDHLDMEPFVDCRDCGRKFHQICVLHMDTIWPEGFVCDGCLKTKAKKRKDNKFSARRLPSTKLGSYIENRVNSFLKVKELGAGEVFIRVVSSSDKFVEIKPLMKQKFGGLDEWPETFPYRAKALFAFEDFNGVDVCFFGMHVQEYGSECSHPNARRVYIAYMDSVHFFQPKQLRTAVYHEILLGYLDYVKQLGYSMAHIWACPPSEGDDYIFHCHPPEQKIPKPKRLQDWYKKMLDKGIIERIVIDYKDIHKQAIEDNFKTAIELPYFEGDFWPNVIEESIKEIEIEQQKIIQQEQRQQQLAENNSQDSLLGSDETSMGKCKEINLSNIQIPNAFMCTDNMNDDEKSNDKIDGEKSSNNSSNDGNNGNGSAGGQIKHKKSSANKKSTKKQNHRKNVNQRNRSGILTPAQWGQELTSKIVATMEKHKEVFFVIRLHLPNSHVFNSSVVDPDGLQNCDLMDGRDAFLTLAREKHYEFSSLRRAKFSSMALLYDLHNSGNGFVYTCNRCKRHVVETRYHCTECDDFDLCVSCFNTEGHSHRMEKLGFGDLVSVSDEGGVAGAGVMGAVAGGDLDGSGDGANSAGGANPGESRRLSIQRCIQSLVHACQCRDANCRLPSCHKMKRVVQHSKNCKRRTSQHSSNQQCQICKQLIALCCYHAKHCNEQKCLVPYCLNIKHKLHQQQLQQKYKQEQILMRRIATMRSTVGATSNSSSSTSPDNNSSASPYMKSSNTVVTPPPVAALAAVQQVQAAVARQQAQPPGSLPPPPPPSISPASSYGKGKPNVISYGKPSNIGAGGVGKPPHVTSSNPASKTQSVGSLPNTSGQMPRPPLPQPSQQPQQQQQPPKASLSQAVQSRQQIPPPPPSNQSSRMLGQAGGTPQQWYATSPSPQHHQQMQQLAQQQMSQQRFIRQPNVGKPQMMQNQMCSPQQQQQLAMNVGQQQQAGRMTMQQASVMNSVSNSGSSLMGNNTQQQVNMQQSGVSNNNGQPGTIQNLVHALNKQNPKELEKLINQNPKAIVSYINHQTQNKRASATIVQMNAQGQPNPVSF